MKKEPLLIRITPKRDHGFLNKIAPWFITIGFSVLAAFSIIGLWSLPLYFVEHKPEAPISKLTTWEFSTFGTNGYIIIQMIITFVLWFIPFEFYSVLKWTKNKKSNQGMDPTESGS